jgi:hypothetical protein
MKIFAGIASLGLFGLCALACSSSSSSSSVSSDQACADYANAVCTKVSTCGPLFLQISYGDVATCTTRFKSLCTGAFAANGTSITADRAEKCVTAFNAAGCDALFDRNTPSDCRATAGSLANGTACGDDNQCQSTYCNKGANSNCGTCGTARSTAGQACNSDDNCDYGLVCAANKLCIARGQAGATCDANHPCASTLYCNAAIGAMSGTCATPNAEGAMCMSGSGLGSCNALVGDFCNPKTKVCQKIVVASGGAACGYDMSSGSYTACGTNGLCKMPALSSTGTCLAAAADGATCDANNGPLCLAGATCVNGVCQKQDATSCK